MSNGILSNTALHHLVDVGCKDHRDGLPDKVERMTWCYLKKLQAFYSVSRGFYYYAGYCSGKYRKSDNSCGQLEVENRRDFHRLRKSSRGDITLGIVQIQDKCYARLVNAIGSYHLNLRIKKSYGCIKIHYKGCTRELRQLGQNKFTYAENYVNDAGCSDNDLKSSYCSSETSEKIEEEQIIERQSSSTAEHRMELMNLSIRRAAEHRQATINEMEYSNCECVRGIMRETRSYTQVKTLQSEMKKSLEYRWDAKEQVCTVRCSVKLVESISVSQSNCRISARIPSSINNNNNNEAEENSEKCETADRSASSQDDCSTSNVAHCYEGAYTVINVSVRQVTWRATITCR